MTTIPSVTFGIYAAQIKAGSTPTASSIQAFSDITDLKTGNVSWQSYATYEPNFWKLDGNYKFIPPTAVHMGWVSAAQSDGSGNFGTPPVLTVTFGAPYSTNGISIAFFQSGPDYCTHVKIQFYDAGSSLIQSNDYYPTSYLLSTGQAVANFKSIVITFYSTNKPNRYLYVRSLDYGTLVQFTGPDIKAATLTEQVDPSGATLPYNAAEIDIYTTNAALSIVAPTGNYSGLQNRQPLDIYETVDGETIHIGRQYLDTWQNATENDIKFTTLDLLGVLDTISCMGGIWLSPVTATSLLTALLGPIGVPYLLDPTLASVNVSGWIPAGTYRSALQLIAIAIGATVTCSRSGILQIIPNVLAANLTAFSFELSAAEKGSNDQSLTLLPLVTSVEITTHDYISNSTSTQLYNGSLSAGTYTIIFSGPAHDLVVTGATISSSGANYAIIVVATPGTVTLSGQGYTDTTKVVAQVLSGLSSSTPTNTISITDATLVNSSNIATVLAQAFAYYQQRYQQKVTLYANPLAAGASVLIDSLFGSRVAGIAEQLSVDLAGGFVSKATITGVIE
jgi:hypothetical protein